MRPLLLAVVFATLLDVRAEAQRPHRTGFWAELGSGPGAVRIGCGGCTDVTVSGGSTGDIRLGGTLTDHVLLGVEIFGFTDERFGFAPHDTSVTAENSSLDAVVLWYPWHGGVFLKGGVGLANGRFTVKADAGQGAVNEGTGVGLTFGAGFDLPISRRFAITANAAAFITAIGDVKVRGVLVDDVIPTMYQLSVGFTLR
jgi:hypothetical protein